MAFSDLKLSPTTGGSQPYVPDIRSVNNYYAFGMLQPWRYFQDVSYAGYKFGFNGMMRDDDIKEQTPGISKKGTVNSGFRN